MSLFPIFLKLDGRPCLVVGAGKTGEAKIEGLLAAGAVVRVVAPTATAQVQAWAQAGTMTWQRRAFVPADLVGATLAVVATSSAELNARVFHEAGRRGVWTNVVDDPAHCDFHYPAVVRRGHLQIAISTNGRSPALAQRLRRELEPQFGPEYAAWLEELGRERAELLAEKGLEPEARRERLHALASRESFEKFIRREFSEGSESPAGQVRDLGAHPARRLLSRPPGRVYLVGAGPGDPDLLTVKAVRVLRQADVVLHDDLVPAPILDLATPAARVLNVGKRCGSQGFTQQEINAWMVGYARDGLALVRLKGGDPLTFGRAGEEARALRQAGVEFEIVPGVTAASAAAAEAGISLTERRVASSVLFLTGHHCAERSGQLPWPALVKGDLPADTTIVVYMPGDDLRPLASQLRAAGLPADTPCLIASRLGTEDRELRVTTLGALPDAALLRSPKLLIIGAVVGAMRDAEPGARLPFDEFEPLTASVG